MTSASARASSPPREREQRDDAGHDEQPGADLAGSGAAPLAHGLHHEREHQPGREQGLDDDDRAEAQRHGVQPEREQGRAAAEQPAGCAEQAQQQPQRPALVHGDRARSAPVQVGGDGEERGRGERQHHGGQQGPGHGACRAAAAAWLVRPIRSSPRSSPPPGG
jgi:hypothetical protein